MLADLLDGDFFDRALGEHLLRGGNQGIHSPLLARVQPALRYDLHRAILCGKTTY
jgi:hypothetical protein